MTQHYILLFSLFICFNEIASVEYHMLYYVIIFQISY